MLTYHDTKPATIEAVGDGSYRYRWAIEEISVNHGMEGAEPITQWKSEEVVVWPPLNSDRVIAEVIRSKYSTSAELALVNKFNAYQQGIVESPDIVNEYSEYLDFVDGVKKAVRAELGEETQGTVSPTAASPRLVDVMSLLTMTVNNMQLSDEQALKVKSVYPAWENKIGENLAKDVKLQHAGRLWKVLQQHTAQLNWEPGKGTESLFTEIVESAAGTLDDPIPYNNNMELFAGKYYSQDGVIYKCNRNTGQPVYNPLSALVGLYVERVN